MNIIGVNAGVALWFSSHKKVCWVPVEEIVRLEQLGLKSVNVKMISDPAYNVYNIPCTAKRVFVTCDWSVLKTIADDKFKTV